jgi:hypothetical protein
MNQFTGTINGKRVGMAPVPVGLGQLPQQVQNDWAGVAGNAPQTTTVETNASAPSEQRSTIRGIDPKTGQVIGGEMGNPSFVVAYPEGTGPTRAKQLTEGQIQDNRNIASRIFSHDANLRPTPLELATKERWNSPGYKGPGLMMQSPAVRRQIEAEANRVQGEQRDTTAFNRTMDIRDTADKQAIALQGEKNKGVIGAAQAAREAAIANENARASEREKLAYINGGIRKDAANTKAEVATSARDVNVINDEWKTWTKPNVQDTDALPHLISLAQEAQAANLHNAPNMKKQMFDTSARLARIIAKSNGFEDDKTRIDLLQKAILLASGDVNHPDVVKLSGSK